MYQWVWPRINRLRPPRHLYQKIEKELKSKPDWPKLGGNSNFPAGKANQPKEKLDYFSIALYAIDSNNRKRLVWLYVCVWVYVCFS